MPGQLTLMKELHECMCILKCRKGIASTSVLLAHSISPACCLPACVPPAFPPHARLFMWCECAIMRVSSMCVHLVCCFVWHARISPPDHLAIWPAACFKNLTMLPEGLMGASVQGHAGS